MPDRAPRATARPALSPRREDLRAAIAPAPHPWQIVAMQDSETETPAT